MTSSASLKMLRLASKMYAIIDSEQDEVDKEIKKRNRKCKVKKFQFYLEKVIKL